MCRIIAMKRSLRNVILMIPAVGTFLVQFKVIGSPLSGQKAVIVRGKQEVLYLETSSRPYLESRLKSLPLPLQAFASFLAKATLWDAVRYPIRF